MDAFLRTKCEGVILAITKEILLYLNEDDATILNEIPTEGGFREY
jgi:hypothetical protein